MSDFLDMHFEHLQNEEKMVSMKKYSFFFFFLLFGIGGMYFLSSSLFTLPIIVGLVFSILFGGIFLGILQVPKKYILVVIFIATGLIFYIEPVIYKKIGLFFVLFGICMIPISISDFSQREIKIDVFSIVRKSLMKSLFITVIGIAFILSSGYSLSEVVSPYMKHMSLKNMSGLTDQLMGNITSQQAGESESINTVLNSLLNEQTQGMIQKQIELMCSGDQACIAQQMAQFESAISGSNGSSIDIDSLVDNNTSAIDLSGFQGQIEETVKTQIVDFFSGDNLKNFLISLGIPYLDLLTPLQIEKIIIILFILLVSGPFIAMLSLLLAVIFYLIFIIFRLLHVLNFTQKEVKKDFFI